MPAGIAQLLRDRRILWRYRTEPEPALGERRLYWPRGRLLGGSSSINAMCYTRGHPRDYEEWAHAAGEAWSYARVLPYFRKAEHYRGGANEYHGERRTAVGRAAEVPQSAERGVRRGGHRLWLCRAMPISTALRRRAWASTTSPSATAAAAAPRALILRPRAGAPTSRCAPIASPRGCCSRQRARAGWSTSGAASPRVPARCVRCCLPAAPSAPRSCCCSRA